MTRFFNGPFRWSLAYFHLLPTGHRSNLLRLYIPRLKSHDCGKVRQVELPFAEPRGRCSRALGRFVIRLAALMPCVS